MKNQYIAICLLLFCSLIMVSCIRIVKLQPPLTHDDALAISSLAHGLSDRYWAIFANVSIEESPLKITQMFIDDDAKKLNLDISVETLKAITDADEFARLIAKTRDLLNQSRGGRASVLFIYEFNLDFVEAILNSLNTAKPENLQKWTQFIGPYMIAAVTAAEALGSDPEQIQRGTHIADVLRKGLTIEDLAKVKQQVREWSNETNNVTFYLAQGIPTPPPTPTMIGAVGTDITRSLPEGNAERGAILIKEKSCSGCHGGKRSVGPAWSGDDLEEHRGIGIRALSRIQAADYTGKAKTAEQYLFESIVQPNAYVVRNYPANVQPQSFGETLNAQETADIIAYLLSFK